MKKTTTAIAVIAALALAGPAAAAKTTTYKGKTSSGHVITFKVKGKRIHDLVTGIRTSCIPIQGGGRPLGGSDVFGWTGSPPLKRHDKYTFMGEARLPLARGHHELRAAG